VADRIIGMREALRGNLENLGSPLSWNHVTDQIGMAIAIEGIKAAWKMKEALFQTFRRIKNGKIVGKWTPKPQPS
jgi:aspartate/tyrosine/aromatic aminotransferase